MISNSKEQDLVLHSIAVGLLSVKIFETHYQELWTEVIKSITEDFESKSYQLENYKKVLFNVGYYHDVGKLDANFQNYLIKNINKAKDFDVQIEDSKDIDINIYPLHHEISWAYLVLQDTIFKNNRNNYHNELFLYSIYWHHSKLLRKGDDLNELNKIINNEKLDLNLLNSNFKKFNEEGIKVLQKISSTNQLAINDYLEFNDLKETIQSNNKITPEFQSILFDKQTAEEISLLRNAINHLTRAILISADRIISQLSKEDLSDIFDTNNINESIILDSLLNNIIDNKDYELYESVNLMKERFIAKSNNSLDSIRRNELQEETVNKISNKNKVTILQGPAGVGKTKIMLEWLGKINNKKKTYIIAPKTNIVNELYNEITQNYLPEVQIEKITGAEKLRYSPKSKISNSIEDTNYFQSTINITTIDQLMSLMMSHDKIDVYLDVLNSNLIFDEFHEFMETPALLMLFIQTITLKKMSKQGRCLLVSATPNPFLIKKLNLSIKNDLVTIPTFNNTKYQINNIAFNDSEKSTEIQNEMFNVQTKGNICIFNTATKAQISSILAKKNNEKDTITYHSKFFSNDRKEIFKKIMSNFGKGKTKEAVLRSGPILQASIDISTSHMLTEISNIDNIYQRLGRVMRWNEGEVGVYDIIIPSNYDRKNLSITRNLSKNGQYEIVKEFIDFLNKNIFILNSIKLNDLYKLYFDFFEFSQVEDAYQKSWDFLKNESNRVFKQGFEPIKIYIKPQKKSKDEKIAAKKSLRGSSIFGFAMTIEDDGYGVEKIIQLNTDKILETFSLDRNFSFDKQEETAIIDELKTQIENNYIKRKYFDNIRELYISKIKSKKKNIKNIPNNIIIDYARNENTPIIFSYIDKTVLTSDQLRYNIVYKGLSIGIINYKKFKDVA